MYVANPLVASGIGHNYPHWVAIVYHDSDNLHKSLTETKLLEAKQVAFKFHRLFRLNCQKLKIG